MSHKVTERQNSILCLFKINQGYKISDLEKAYSTNADTISLSTLKRDLQALVSHCYITMVGQKRATLYKISPIGILKRYFGPEYLNTEITKRNALTEYNYQTFDYLTAAEIFTDKEIEKLTTATKIFHDNARLKNSSIEKKELERFVIELSWKSSKIEGNTYTLLDTEFLIREGIESKTNTKEEATMILNHKAAFSYILELRKEKKNIFTLRELENIHRLLVEGLEIDHGIRRSAVGITGSAYKPLSYDVQIKEELHKLLQAIKTIKNPYTRGLCAVLGIAYLQPFNDGNKRTARLFSNAILLFAELSPLSYRTVDEKKYREATLIFYEQNSIENMKEIFIEQYIFAAHNYNIG